MLNQEEKNGMIAMTYQEWSESNDPEKDEFYQAIIHLINMGMVSAYYDDNDDCVKYASNSGG